jgi:DNA-binding LacI/PurR family transcriptional regulator
LNRFDKRRHVDEGQARRSTLKDVARLAGVSPATASMALSDNPRVAEATKTAVRDAAARLGYVPHAAGRALRSQRVGAIAVVLPHSSEHVFSHPTLTALLEGIVSVAAENDLSTVLSTSSSEQDEASAYRRLMQGRQADGAIVASASVADANVIELARSAYPLVVVGRVPHLPHVTTVCLDDYHGGEAATRHLVQVHGARRVAHISGPLGHQSAQDKLTGYRAALVAAAIAPDPALEVEGDYSDGGGYEAVERLLRARTSFEAVFAANDQMALGAAGALRAHGLAVPRDVPLVGYDDILLGRYASPALTSVQGDMAAVGALAARRLLSLMDGHPVPETVTFLPTGLVVRRSCGCAEDHTMAEASLHPQSATTQQLDQQLDQQQERELA